MLVLSNYFFILQYMPLISITINQFLILFRTSEFKKLSTSWHDDRDVYSEFSRYVLEKGWLDHGQIRIRHDQFDLFQTFNTDLFGTRSCKTLPILNLPVFYSFTYHETKLSDQEVMYHQYVTVNVRNIDLFQYLKYENNALPEIYFVIYWREGGRILFVSHPSYGLAFMKREYIDDTSPKECSAVSSHFLKFLVISTHKIEQNEDCTLAIVIPNCDTRVTINGDVYTNVKYTNREISRTSTDIASSISFLGPVSALISTPSRYYMVSGFGQPLNFDDKEKERDVIDFVLIYLRSCTSLPIAEIDETLYTILRRLYKKVKIIERTYPIFHFPKSHIRPMLLNLTTYGLPKLILLSLIHVALHTIIKSQKKTRQTLHEQQVGSMPEYLASSRGSVIPPDMVEKYKESDINLSPGLLEEPYDHFHDGGKVLSLYEGEGILNHPHPYFEDLQADLNIHPTESDGYQHVFYSYKIPQTKFIFGFGERVIKQMIDIDHQLIPINIDAIRGLLRLPTEDFQLPPQVPGAGGVGGVLGRIRGMFMKKKPRKKTVKIHIQLPTLRRHEERRRIATMKETKKRGVPRRVVAVTDVSQVETRAQRDQIKNSMNTYYQNVYNTIIQGSDGDEAEDELIREQDVIFLAIGSYIRCQEDGRPELQDETISISRGTHVDYVVNDGTTETTVSGTYIHPPVGRILYDSRPPAQQGWVNLENFCNARTHV